MNQQVNLYLEEFRIKKDPITPLLMGKILGCVLLVMVLISTFDFVNQWRLGNELAELEAELDVETERTDQLDEQLARRSQNSELTARLERAERQLNASIQIRDFLSETQLGNVTGFSEYFKDLSRASFAGISLDGFSFTEGGRLVRLAGQVQDSAMVPRYVDNIERGQSPLSNQQFSPRISRSAITDQIFEFELSSSRE